MKRIKEEADGGAAPDGGEVVVVGVKFDAESRELLTWALMNVAKPGDRVIALHVLDSITEFVEGTASLLSLVKTFDSLLAVYEGFCNLKQVDLKLKLCKGSSARKILVKEAKSSCAAKLILGTSKTHHSIRSSTSLAKYCARNLSKSVSVFAVTNGKIMFQREATVHHLQDALSDNSVTTNILEERHEDGYVDNSLALVPVQTKLPDSKRGWSIFRVFLPNGQHSRKTHAKSNSVVKCVLKLPSCNSSSVVYPDQKQTILYMKKEDHCSNLEVDNGAIVPIMAPQGDWFPISPCHSSDGLPEELKDLHEKYSSSCRLFSYEELRLATSNFMPEKMVGKGGSSHVFKGVLPDGKELAVKILKPSQNVLKEFVAEIEIITTLHHKNIISLFGFCFDNKKLFLVYEFLSRGSLQENLHGNKKDVNAFGWLERSKVAMGVAEALYYLHNLSDQPVIHRDVKSSNILLSDDFEPQLSDFGLATWSLTSSTHITCTDVAGTFGYLAPEYFMHGKVSEKIDVFAFGVVLLELLSGKMPINGENRNGQESLVMWAKPILEDGKVSQLLDPQIEGKYDGDQIERMVLAATLCIRRSPRIRPQIKFIMKLLQGDSEVTNWARQQVMTSEVDISDEETFHSNMQSHLNIALLDIEDDSASISSDEKDISIEDYLKGRCSRTSSFD